ncbi:MAG: CHAD domain-containing protein, partial [Campylobacter sp.]|nr:CHAD domain-containing protein [Campylobacter sp.]
IDAKDFKFSQNLEKFIVKEVTNDERYKNKNIALYGDPNLKINLDKVLSLVKKSPNLTLNFPSYIDAYQGFRLLFNQIYIDIDHYKNRYLISKDPEDLHQFRVSLRKTRSILKIAKELYNPEILTEILENFKVVAKSTNQRRDFDVFIEYLEGIEGSKDAVESLKFVINKQIYGPEEMLNCLKYKMFFLDYDGFLADSEAFYRDKKIAIKPFVAKLIRTQIVEVEKKVIKLSAESLNSEFHQTRIELKRLRYLLESFASMFELKAINTFFKTVKEVQDLFGELQDRDVWCSIIDMYDKGDAGEFLKAQKSKISIDMFEIRREILDDKRKFMSQAMRVSRVLKVYY